MELAECGKASVLSCHDLNIADIYEEPWMVHYRRSRVPGGTYFFTLTLQDRTSTLLVDHIDLLRQAWRKPLLNRPVENLAVVVLPDHLHVLWRLPENDMDYSSRWRGIKAEFTRLLRKRVFIASRRKGSGFALWQRRYWEHMIRDEEDLRRHMSYIHFNPVKHGCVSQVVDWPHSTFHKYVKDGLYPADWGYGELLALGEFGE